MGLLVIWAFLYARPEGLGLVFKKMAKAVPSIVVAGTASGVGKTTMTAGIIG